MVFAGIEVHEIPVFTLRWCPKIRCWRSRLSRPGITNKTNKKQYFHLRNENSSRFFATEKNDLCAVWYLLIHTESDPVISTDSQGPISHCAGCTMGGGPRRQGGPINCQIFTTLFWRLNVRSETTRFVAWNEMKWKVQWFKVRSKTDLEPA